jgi:hypothetical protein
MYMLALRCCAKDLRASHVRIAAGRHWKSLPVPVPAKRHKAEPCAQVEHCAVAGHVTMVLQAHAEP